MVEEIGIYANSVRVDVEAKLGKVKSDVSLLGFYVCLFGIDGKS